MIKKIQDVRNELFPKEPFITFTPQYCAALDTNSPEYNLYKLYLDTTYIPTKINNHNNQFPTQEIVILANNTMLKQLSASSQWFVDGTFKIAPKSFYQILNIIVYISHLKIFYPACHIFMTHKTEELYSIAFSNLKIISETLKFPLHPTVIMCDFENGLRNSLKQCFPEANLSGCYFHYTKCLFEKLKKLGLRKSPFKKQSYALVCYLQILIHSPVEKRNLLFDKLDAQFKNIDDKFDSFQKYYKNNWLKHSFLDELFKALKENEDSEFIRTNNPCKTFHLFLSRNFSFKIIFF